MAGTMVLAGLSLAAGADPPHAPQDIRRDVEAFLVRELADPSLTRRVAVNDLDPRLRLPRCESPLEMSIPPGSARVGSVTVSVRCPGPRPWSLYVPARVRTLGPVVVLARPAAPGAALQPTDLRVEERDLGGLTGGYFADPAALLGRTLKRSIVPGQPVTPSALASAVRIRRGERVVLLTRALGLDVRMQGEALRDGAVGEAIGVRNLSSQRVVEGRVTAEGAVEIAM